MPHWTYVARAERKLEAQVREAEDNLCKLVTVTGPTKSGKTVLTNRVFPRSKTIWIDGGSVDAEDDFWTQIIDAIAGYTGFGGKAEVSREDELALTSEARAKLPGISARSTAKVGVKHRVVRASEISRTLTPRAAALTQLRRSNIPLVIDDFHYLKRLTQGSVIRALKPLIFDGFPVILLAIPHRRYDAIRVEREMTSRIESVRVPSWDPDELQQIPDEGFPLLKVYVSAEVVSAFTSEAYGSPHLMQEFCRELCRHHEIKETLPKQLIVDEVPSNLFQNVAEKTGRAMFDKLARGPRQRTDRNPRPLRKGGTADIYLVVLYALASMEPGMEMIPYEQLRSAIRDVLSDSVPQAHEVSRVLDKMAEIAANDEASTPVLDWEKDERRIHITDPFFAFYLRWGGILEGQ